VWSSGRTDHRAGLSLCIADGGIWAFGKHFGLAGCGISALLHTRGVGIDMVNRRTAARWQAYFGSTHCDWAEVGWRSYNIGRTVRALAPGQIDIGSENIILASRKTHFSIFHFLHYSPSRSPYFRSYLTSFLISPLVPPQALSRLSDLRLYAFQFTSSSRLSLTSFEAAPTNQTCLPHRYHGHASAHGEALQL